MFFLCHVTRTVLAVLTFQWMSALERWREFDLCFRFNSPGSPTRVMARVSRVMDYLGRLLLSLFLLSWEGKLFQVNFEMSNRPLLSSTERVELFIGRVEWSHCASVSISSSGKVAMI